MKPDPAVPADQLNLLRQQLILAQVRIMELEDVRDELTPKLAETAQLLTAAQTLADAKLDESAHLTQVLSELQAQSDHQRHVLHVTNEALDATRAESALIAAREKALLTEVENLQILTRQLSAASREQSAQISRLDAELAAARAESATRLERIDQLDTELRTMKSSRSWRWTAWLRSLERALGGKP